MIDWFLVTCGGAALYAASRWLRTRLKTKKPKSKLQRSRQGQPLRVVVAQCEAKWFLQELQLAMSGDTAAMVRVSHMLLSGYGTRQDHAAAAHWMRKAWAIQNFKEPADGGYHRHDMLDIRASDIPALNDAQQYQTAAIGPAPASATAVKAAQTAVGHAITQTQSAVKAAPAPAQDTGGTSSSSDSSTSSSAGAARARSRDRKDSQQQKQQALQGQSIDSAETVAAQPISADNCTGSASGTARIVPPPPQQQKQQQEQQPQQQHGQQQQQDGHHHHQQQQSLMLSHQHLPTSQQPGRAPTPLQLRLCVTHIPQQQEQEQQPGKLVPQQEQTPQLVETSPQHCYSQLLESSWQEQLACAGS